MEIKDASHGFILRIIGEIESSVDDNIDIEVELAGGELYTATLATIENVKSIMERYAFSGECLGGKYFWATGLILTKSIDKVNIHKIVVDMLLSGELFKAFDGPHDIR